MDWMVRGGFEPSGPFISRVLPRFHAHFLSPERSLAGETRFAETRPSGLRILVLMAFGFESRNNRLLYGLRRAGLSRPVAIGFRTCSDVCRERIFSRDSRHRRWWKVVDPSSLANAAT